MRSLLLLTCVLSGCCFGQSAAPRPGARMERIVDELLPEFPEVQRHFAGMTYDESFVAGGVLSHRGMPRLPDDELLAFARLRERLLRTSDAACEAMVGTGDQHAAMAAFESLPDDELRAWARITTHAQSLELRGGPRPLDREQAAAGVEQAIARIREALPDAERARWDVAVASTLPADACFVERCAMREVGRMPDGGAVLRAILEGTQPP